jgi:hypothetical protein
VGVHSRAQGPEHPDIFRAMISLYATMWEPEDPLKACQLLERCAATAVRVGADHGVARAAACVGALSAKGNQHRM